MSSAADEARLIELVEAFTELGPAWVRWVHASLPDDTVSYARIRALTALACRGEQTMKQLATALEVTARRVTALVDALEHDELVERYQHPTDGRSTLVAITGAGLEQQQLSWKQHQRQVAQAFGDLTIDDQERLLDIARALTDAFRKRLAARAASGMPESRAVRRPVRRRGASTAEASDTSPASPSRS